MSNQYEDKEVNKIINEEGHEFPKNIALAATWIMGNLKGINLKILDMSKKSSLADYYVLASATNPTQAKAMAEQVIVQVKKHGVNVNGFEGKNDTDWMLVDLGDVLVHIFLESSRGVYNLDGLWADSPTVEIPQHYYFSKPDKADDSSQGPKDYF